eukprot:4027734-Pleurochrysis_carterae.AAC.1
MKGHSSPSPDPAQNWQSYVRLFLNQHTINYYQHRSTVLLCPVENQSGTILSPFSQRRMGLYVTLAE